MSCRRILARVTQARAPPVDITISPRWRYMPALGGRRSSTWQFTTLPSETTITETQVGKGSIDWQQLTWEQNPTLFHEANALAALPLLEYLPAVVAKISTNAVLPVRPTRALR
ncbi:MAG: acetoacetate decarboxylase [Zhongshania sp.]|jgi:acetoacetate decarboxylase